MGPNFFAAKLYLAIASSELSQASMAYTRCYTPAQLVFGLGQYMELQTISQIVLITILLILIEINYPQKREGVHTFICFWVHHVVSPHLAVVNTAKTCCTFSPHVIVYIPSHPLPKED